MSVTRTTLLAVAFSLGTSAALAASGQPEAKASLYDRLGGLRGISVAVDDFMNRIAANPVLTKNAALKAAEISSPLPYLKFQVTQKVCEMAGGPCKYTGLSMKDAHGHLQLTDVEWTEMAGEFQRTLDRYSVPAAEQKELFDGVGSLKGDVVVGKAK